MPQQVFAGLEPPYTNLQQAKTVILPVPYDGTSEWRSGSRHGPRAIIDASQYLELYDLELDREIYKVGISTLPQVEPLLSSPQDMIHRVYQVVRGLVQKEKFVVLLGGEHSLSLGAVRAFKEAFPRLSVLQMDAHADLRDEYLGTKYSQACVMRRIFELCPISQVGVRSLSWEERQFLTENKLRPFYISDLTSDKASVNQIVDSLTEDVYITIDADVLDPSIMPAVGTPEPDGMPWRQVLNIIESVMLHRHVVGFDLMEFCPAEGTGSCAFLLAKLAYRLIGSAVPQEGQ
ncbi:MAG: agmatinase [Chloroflexi bacterium RBG_13_51_36]|nr:MAG: agmatinase [Chloroflexi bacterium RBG_13_51_36]